ncbi:hypothetical protein [Sphingomonas asaccharolytica]|uniref:hypothetical protein n=1 Tax=Sphingomonas asaccharolytica TaxID=40681 RepID=UPI001C3FC773|nr:hypothetical protein [Sphingomonas asaccharolytica]
MVALSVGTAFLWFTLPISLGFYLAGGRPDLALRFAPHHADALAADADLAIFKAKDARQIELVAGKAREALLRSPLQVSALRNLAFVDAMHNRNSQAAAAFALAGRLSLRDFPTHFWLLRSGYELGDYNATLREADILLNEDSDTWQVLIPMLVQLQEGSPLRGMIVRMIARAHPVWASSYLQELGRSGRPEGAFATFRDLQSAGHPASVADLTPYFRRASTDVDPTTLYHQWRALADGKGGDQRLRNGDFDGANPPAPFGWDLSNAGGNYAELSADPGGRPGNALHFLFSDSYVSLASQGMILGSGSYRLTGEVYLDSAQEASSVRVRVLCSLNDGGAPIVVATLPGTSANWNPFAISFTVPRGCAGQRLIFDGMGDNTLQPASVWIDRLAIVPAKEEH